jgi:hypothetical protein
MPWNTLMCYHHCSSRPHALTALQVDRSGERWQPLPLLSKSTLGIVVQQIKRKPPQPSTSAQCPGQKWRDVDDGGKTRRGGTDCLREGILSCHYSKNGHLYRVSSQYKASGTNVVGHLYRVSHPAQMWIFGPVDLLPRYKWISRSDVSPPHSVLLFFSFYFFPFPLLSHKFIQIHNHSYS